MNHSLSLRIKKMPPDGGRNRLESVILLFLVLALLVGDTAAGLAGGLAGGLAFAATAVLRALAQITGVQSLNMLHGNYPPSKDFIRYFITEPLFESMCVPFFFAAVDAGPYALIMEPQ
jgi:hypothetical protein